MEDSSDEESMSSEEEEPSYSPAQVQPDDVDLPEIGDLVYMYITHVQSPKNICMRNIDGDNGKILEKMEDKLTDYVNDAGTPFTSVQVSFFSPNLRLLKKKQRLYLSFALSIIGLILEM